MNILIVSCEYDFFPLLQDQTSLRSEEYRQLFRLPPDEVSIIDICFRTW